MFFGRYKKKWNNDFQGQFFFSLSKTNSCGVAIGYYGKKFFELPSKFNDKSVRILIIKVKIQNKLLLLTNLYSTNIENEQLSTLSDLSNMLEKINEIIKALYLEEILICSLKLN